VVLAMNDVMFMLVFGGLVCVLLMAMVVPAPERAADNEADVHLQLLALGCLAIVLTGALALANRPTESIVFGAVAWLVVTPCVWLARAPQSATGWDELEEDDDDGGSPPPHSPSSPPAPDDVRAAGTGAGAPAARGEWIAAPAFAFGPAMSSAELALPAWALAAPVSGTARPWMPPRSSPAVGGATTGWAPPAPSLPVPAPATPRAALAASDRPRARRRVRGEHGDPLGAGVPVGRRRRRTLLGWMRRPRRDAPGCVSAQGTSRILPSLPPAANRS
jgi:hypothetical protein